MKYHSVVGYGILGKNIFESLSKNDEKKRKNEKKRETRNLSCKFDLVWTKTIWSTFGAPRWSSTVYICQKSIILGVPKFKNERG